MLRPSGAPGGDGVRERFGKGSDTRAGDRRGFASSIYRRRYFTTIRSSKWRRATACTFRCATRQYVRLS